MTNLIEEEQKRALIMRLKRVEGQLRGVQRLIEEEASCEAIAQQMSASRNALDKAYHSMIGCLLESHLEKHGIARSDVKPLADIISRYG